jgi:hypothetical protein
MGRKRPPGFKPLEGRGRVLPTEPGKAEADKGRWNWISNNEHFMQPTSMEGCVWERSANLHSSSDKAKFAQFCLYNWNDFGRPHIRVSSESQPSDSTVLLEEVEARTFAPAPPSREGSGTFCRMAEVNQANWVWQLGNEDASAPTRGENKPEETVFEVRGSWRMDFRKVSALFSQPWAPENFSKTDWPVRTLHQEGGRFQTDQKPLWSSETPL